MTSDQIKKVCKKYDEKLIELGIENKQDNETFGSLNHIKWMINEIPFFLEYGDKEKSMRWLGFIQGVLWSKEIYSIDQMREHNK